MIFWLAACLVTLARQLFFDLQRPLFRYKVPAVENYDILMLIVLAGATIFGAVKGFAWQLASIASIVVSYVVAYRFREPFSQMIKAEPPWNRLFAMLLLYIGTSLVVWMLFRMVAQSIDRMKLKEFDRQIGAAFGLAKGAIYCSLVTLFAVTLLGPESRQKIVSSRSGLYIARFLDRSRAIMPPEVTQVVRPYLDRFDREVQQSGGGQFGYNPMEPMQPTAPGAFPWPAGGEQNGNGFSPGGFIEQTGTMIEQGNFPPGFDPRGMLPPQLWPQAQQPSGATPFR
jgi:membrane protein required for colicin V production